jgi:uncharacterized protein YpiB (UPF0302 family)
MMEKPSWGRVMEMFYADSDQFIERLYEGGVKILEKERIPKLIDKALADGDKESFMQLTNKMRGCTNGLDK